MKKIRSKARDILVVWIKEIIKKEDHTKVTRNNISKLVESQSYYWSGYTLRLQPWSYKWIVKKLNFYGPRSMVTNASNTVSMFNGNPNNQYVSPSENVPYIIVRDNTCLVYEVGDSFTSNHILSVRLEVAQITLDQATLNQLLRTQTV